MFRIFINDKCLYNIYKTYLFYPSEQFKNPLPAQYDSIISEGWMFREFVVKEDDRIYPEYVITYTRQ